MATKAAIIALMVLGSLSLWIGSPVFWLWLTAKLQSDGTQAKMGPYALLLIGVILSSVGIGKGLSSLQRLYGRATGTTPTVQVILPWRRSLRGGRSQKRETDGRLPLSVLDVVMVLSVMVAVAAFLAWYVITNPTPPNVGGPGPAKH
ncbi:MAG: hypothetical protein ACJ76V_03250 [Thermoleophilaceae bacterium]